MTPPAEEQYAGRLFYIHLRRCFGDTFERIGKSLGIGGARTAMIYKKLVHKEAKAQRVDHPPHEEKQPRPLFVRKTDAAWQLQCSVRTIDRYLQGGGLEGRVRGAHTLVTQDSIDRLLSSLPSRRDHKPAPQISHEALSIGG